MNDYGTVLRIDDSDLVEIACMIWTDQHHEVIIELLDANRVLEGVTDDLVADTVSVRALSDERVIHYVRVVLVDGVRKLTWNVWPSRRTGLVVRPTRLRHVPRAHNRGRNRLGT